MWGRVLARRAFQAGRPPDLSDQHGKASPPGRVRVVVDVLAQQHDLSRPLLDSLAALGDHSAHRDVALAAAHLGHDAEGAVVLASLADAHVMADSSASPLAQRLPLRLAVTSL